MSSTICSKKNNNSRKLSSSSSMHNLNENAIKKNIYENINYSRSSKNILKNEKALPFLNISSNKQLEIDNDERGIINFKFNRYKNSTKKESIDDKMRNELNFDFLTERIKNKKFKKQ